MSILVPMNTLPNSIVQYDEVFPEIGVLKEIVLLFNYDKSKGLCAQWQISEDKILSGIITPLHEHYFRCQFYDRDLSLGLNLVIPCSLEIDKPTWTIYSVINKKDFFCGAAVRNTKKIKYPIKRQSCT
jgi:hypothetical protein